MNPKHKRNELQFIRKKNKAIRSSLSSQQIEATSVLIANRLWRTRNLMRARKIACYFAVNGEVSCEHFINQAWSRGREIFLPVVSGKELNFAQYSPETSLTSNRFGIPEPACSDADLTAGRHLDVVLAPLVAFDHCGHRVGMGGGFYDRTFHFLLTRSHWKRPCLIGLAYDFQLVNRLQPNAFDVPMQKILTATSSHVFD